MSLMDWNKCEKEFIYHVEVDIERIKSITSIAENRISTISSLKEDEKSIPFMVEGYYEAIKELLVAYLLANGLRSKNHQCLFSYFYLKNKDKEHDTMLLTKLSYYRNRLNYYGESIPSSFYLKNKEDILNIVKTIKDLIKKQLSA